MKRAQDLRTGTARSWNEVNEPSLRGTTQANDRAGRVETFCTNNRRSIQGLAADK